MLRIRKSGGTYGLECGGNEASMFARIGGMRALNRGHVREFDVSQKRASLGAEEAQEGSVTGSRRAAPPEKNGMPDGPISRGFGSWPRLRVRTAGKVRLSVHQRADAAPLHKSRRTSSTNCPMTACPMTGVTIVPIQPLRRRRPEPRWVRNSKGACLPLSAADATRIWRAPSRACSERPMTVLIYVDISKEVGDHDHLKVFTNADVAETWFEEMTRKALRSSMRFWSDPHRRIAVGDADDHPRRLLDSARRR